MYPLPRGQTVFSSFVVLFSQLPGLWTSLLVLYVALPFLCPPSFPQSLAISLQYGISSLGQLMLCSARGQAPVPCLVL